MLRAEKPKIFFISKCPPRPRGAIRCVAIGNIIAIPGMSGCSEASHNIIKEARRSMEFYWYRDKAWPYAGARLALISMPRGGFPTSHAVDLVPKPTSAPR
jgi:hypothetical protein